MTSQHYDPNQPRQPAGTEAGGQWVKTPGGGQRPAGEETIAHRKGRTWVPGHRGPNGEWILGTGKSRREGTLTEDWWRANVSEKHRRREAAAAHKLAIFKGHKRTAAARFAAKEKEAHAAGMRGPATIRKLLREGHGPNSATLNMGAEGVWRRRRGKWLNRPMAAGETSPGGKHKLKFVEVGGKHIWTARQPTPPPESKTARHARHRAMRGAKAAEAFKAKKNWAAKNLALRRAGKPELPHPEANLKRGDVDPSGRFMWGAQRNVRGKLVPGGRGEWRLIQTADRGKAVMPVHVGAQSRTSAALGQGVHAGGSARVHVHVGGPDIRLRAGPWDAGTAHTADDGTVMEILPTSGEGIFTKKFVKVQGDGQGVFKTDGYDRSDFGGIDRGFAVREVYSYEVDKLLGLNIVPETHAVMMSKGQLNPDHGPYHSLQAWVSNAHNASKERHRGAVYGSLADKTEVGRMFMLDAILGNSDRHEENWMITTGQTNRHIYAIDNGLSMVSRDRTPVTIHSWRCYLSFNHGEKAPMPRRYQAALQTALNDGSLRKIVNEVKARTTGRRSDDWAGAVMARAVSLVKNWDDNFVDA